MLKIVKRGKGNFSLFRFSGIGCGKGCLSCGVIQKGRFCPCGEWRGDGLLSSRSELRFDRTVLSPAATNSVIFFENRLFYRKRNVSLTKIPVKEPALFAVTLQRVQYLAAHTMANSTMTRFCQQIIFPVMNTEFFIAGSK